MEVAQNCSYEGLNFDEACVVLKKQINTPDLWLYTLSSDCVACPYTKRTELLESEMSSIIINTAKSSIWRVIESSKNEEYISASNANGLYCQVTPYVNEFGIYELTVDYNNSCKFDVIKEGKNSNIPLAIAVGIIILLLSSLSIFKLIKRCLRKHCGTRGKSLEREENLKAKRRMRSLDTVRGMSILLMIFVNNGAGGYSFFEHATWNGLYVGDLVFPCFMWIMGVCIPLSISSQLSRGTSRLSLCWAIVKRSFYLFLIGISLTTLGGHNQLESIRIFGVLQRFGICYFVTSIVYTLAIRSNSIDPRNSTSKSGIHDVLVLLPQWIIALCILAAHCVIVFLLPVPNCPKGYFGPGGRHADGKYLNCIGGATGYVDKLLLGVDHIYQSPTANTVYGSGPFDPEGILGCLTSIFQVFLGIQAGQIIRDYQEWKSRLLRWLAWALILGIIGSILHYTNIIPVNKNLWSISFVMITTCLSLALLSACYLLIDVLRIWQGGPFRIPGMNALVMYVGHHVFYEMFPFHWKIGKMNTHSWMLAESLWCVALWTCIAYVLHRKKIYVSL